MTPTIDAILGLCLLLLLAGVVAALLRKFDVAGAALLGGAIAGVLLGPTLMGRVAPELHERAFVGGVEERATLLELESEASAWRFAVGEAAVRFPPADGVELDHDDGAARVAAIEEARTRMERATLAHRRWARNVAMALAIVVLASVVIPARSRDRTTRPLIAGGGWAIGGFSAVIAGGGGIAVALTIGAAPLDAAALACGAALAVGPWRLSYADLRIARAADGDGPATMALAGVTATTFGVALLVVALQRSDAIATSIDSLPYAIVLATLALIGITLLRRMRHESLANVALCWVVAGVAALVAVRLELHLDARLWPLLLLPLLTGDGRWIGGMIGALLLGGRGPGPASRLLLVLAAAGPTQAAMAAIGLWTEVLPPALAMGLLLGALVADLTGRLRRSAERAIRDVESTIEDDSA